MSCWAVIPARNEGQTIREIASSTRAYVDGLIVVDDGSEDDTAAQLEGLDLVRLSHQESRGKAAALATGFGYALSQGAASVVTLDGDGQHDPADIPRLREAADAWPDHLVIGARLRERHHQPGIRRFANQTADFWISWASGQRVPDSQTGFRLYPAALLRAVHPSVQRRHGFVYEAAMLIDGARAGFRCVAVAIDSVYRKGARPSFFRPGMDVWEIFWFVFRRIVLRALCLPSLWRMLITPTRFHREPVELPR